MNNPTATDVRVMTASASGCESGQVADAWSVADTVLTTARIFEDDVRSTFEPYFLTDLPDNHLSDLLIETAR